MSTKDGSKPPRRRRTPEERAKFMEKLADETEQLYKQWGGGRLRDVIEQIDRHILIGDANMAPSTVMESINSERERAILDFVEHKQKRNPGFTASKIRGLSPQVHMFPSNTWEMNYWFMEAKSTAFEVEKFISHTLRRNPSPRPRKDGKAAYEDPRPPRDALEQKWLRAEDRLSKILMRKKRRFGKKKKSDAPLQRPLRPLTSALALRLASLGALPLAPPARVEAPASRTPPARVGAPAPRPGGRVAGLPTFPAFPGRR